MVDRPQHLGYGEGSRGHHRKGGHKGKKGGTIIEVTDEEIKDGSPVELRNSPFLIRQKGGEKVSFKKVDSGEMETVRKKTREVSGAYRPNYHWQRERMDLVNPKSFSGDRDKRM